ncbi:MAG: DUF2917 domain-containing protein [Piscinibacter sp.]|nr:DUF2917 domain-containing protein [Piscinibacter sp.]
MKVQFSATELSLPRRETLGLADPAGVRLTVRRGSLWITLDHDLRDIVLRAGESITFDTAAPVIVQALDPACIGLSQAPATARAPQATPRWLGELGAAFARLQLRPPAWSS